MINSGVFDYINILDKAADAAYTRQEILANNMANVSTPNYKRQDVAFESILEAAIMGSSDIRREVAKVNFDLRQLDAFVYTDQSSLSYRIDGNNVDVDQEQAYIAENQIRYQALVDQMNQEFSRYKMVLNSN